MKRLSIALICALAANLHARGYREYSQEELERKSTHFQHMQVAGFTMAGCGVALVVLGGVLVGTAKYETQYDAYTGENKRITNDPQWPVGFLSIVAGVPLGVTGLILGSIGTHKHAQYESMLSSTSLRLELGDRKGVSLAYGF